MKNKKKKNFLLEKKNDYIIYIHSLVIRTESYKSSLKEAIDKLEDFIKNEKLKNKNIKESEIKVDYKIYNNFRKRLMGDEGYLYNLIGDGQKSAISYFKFRSIIKKIKSNNSLGFEIRDIEENVEKHLKEMNRFRNWANHVPESLLVSEMELIKEDGINYEIKGDIVIYNFRYCSLEYMIQLLKESTNIYNIVVEVHQSMKKDLGSLIGEHIYIKKDYQNIVKGVKSKSNEIARRSLIIQNS